VIAAICAAAVGYFVVQTGNPIAIVAVIVLGLYLIKKKI
jgi:hypothetical protein